jgi:hypothetical protein
MRKMLLSSVAISAVAMALVPSVGHAGFTWSGATCVKNSGGDGYCEGNFNGFRTSSDPNAYYYFFETETGNQQFGANLNGGWYYCSVPSTSPLMSIWRDAMNNRGWFRISWNASSQCTGLTLYNSSAYSY